MTFKPGENVGPYRIVEQLGQGGMATVFKAFHANLERYVAIKVLHPVFKQDEHFQGRFQREAKVVAQLEHPNIVPVYDFDQHEGNAYLVMRFVEGQTLKARLARGPLLPDQAVAMMDSVGEALTYAHERGVLHRDIKPSNILLTEDGKIFLTDFGLARIAQAGESTLSQDMMLGTPAYISPEQARGNQELDAGTDIYSMGVVLYEMTVGQVPFSADTPYAVIHDHIFTPLPPPRSVNPNVPESVERVLFKALAKEREDRYASAKDLAAAFREAVAVAGVEAFESMAATMPIPQPLSVEAPPAPVSDTDTAIPSPTGALDAKPRRRGWLWALGALAVGAFLCLLALVFVIGPAARERRAEREAAESISADAEQPVPLSDSQEPMPPPSEGHCAEEGIDELPLDVAQAQADEYPDNACARLELAIAFSNEGLVEEARVALQEAADMGLSGPTLMAVGDRLAGEENFVEAAKVYGVAYALEGVPEAEVQAFWALTQAGESPEGEDALHGLADRWPHLAFPKSALAVTLAGRGELPDAEATAVDAIVVQPRSPVAHYAMSLVFLAQERQTEARVQLACVLRALDTPPELLEEAQNQLQELGPLGRDDIELPSADGDLPRELLGCAIREP